MKTRLRVRGSLDFIIMYSIVSIIQCTFESSLENYTWRYTMYLDVLVHASNERIIRIQRCNRN